MRNMRSPEISGAWTGNGGITHRYYTGKEWENVENYDMMLNSGVLGTDGCVECILSYLKIRGLYPA